VAGGGGEAFSARAETHAMAQKKDARDGVVILVVEDNPVNQLLLKKKIAQAGFPPPLAAKTGQEALAVALARRPDLVLMDIQLPDMNGNDVIRSLRRQEFTAPIVAISADRSPEDLERCRAAGANGHIGKPIDFAVFFERIGEFLPPAAAARDSAPAPAPGARISPTVSAEARDVLIADAREKRDIIASALARSGEEGQLERIKAIAHEYKGSAGYFGLNGLEGIACELDAAFKNGECPERLKELSGRLLAEIEGILHENP
jgi:CheY-like chemotaxis protein